MKRTIVMLALGFLAAAAMAAGESPAAVQNLADRHIARGLKCESCHADAAHPAPVKKEKCLSCHGGSYEKLAEQTDSLEINPHDSHLGKIECTKCHRGHKPAVLECARCHDFSRQLHIR